MIDQEVLYPIVREALLLIVYLSLPFLGAVVLASLLTLGFQALFKTSDPSLSIVPRIIAALVAVVFAGAFVGHRLLQFTSELWQLIASV